MLESAMMGGLRGVDAHLAPNQRAARLRLFSPGGHLAKELANNPTVLIVNDTMFAHGGVLMGHVQVLACACHWIRRSRPRSQPPFSITPCMPPRQLPMRLLVKRSSAASVDTAVHGAQYGLERINAEVAAWMRGDRLSDGSRAPPPFLAMGCAPPEAFQHIHAHGPCIVPLACLLKHRKTLCRSQHVCAAMIFHPRPCP